MNQTLDKFKEHLQKMRQYEQAVCLLNWESADHGSQKGSGKQAGNPGLLFYRVLQAFHIRGIMGLCCRSFPRPELFAQLDEGMQLTVKRGLRDYQRFQRVPQDF